MATGFQKTLELLATTRNEAAVDALLPQLDSPNSWVRDGAIETLLRRRSPAGHREVIRRLHDLPHHWRPIVERHYGRMSTALRDAVLSSDPALCRNACHAILWFREYDLMPALVNAAEDRSSSNSEPATATVLRLAEILYDELANRRENQDRRDPYRIRGHLVACLEKSLTRYPTHRRRELVEAFLLLADRDNYTLRCVLDAPLDPCHRAVVESLAGCPLAGVMRLLLGYLDDSNAPYAAIGILGRRSDIPFLTRLLHKVQNGVSRASRRHLKKIDHIAWLDRGGSLLGQLDSVAQQGLVAFVVESGLPRAALLDALEMVLRQGAVPARIAACAALSDFSGQRANRMVTESLDDADPEIQAKAISQLRSKGIPGAIGLLITALESAHSVVREAAQSALGEFSFQRYLASFDTLSEKLQRTTGKLVRKVDTRSAELLQIEFAAPTPTRRLRAVEVAVAMGFEWELEEAFCRLLKGDESHFVRAAAAEALAGHTSPRAKSALAAALHDVNAAVRESAKTGLVPLHPPPSNTAEVLK